MTEDVLFQPDAALETYVYDKIRDEMSAKDRFYVSFIARKDFMRTEELPELSGSRKNEFSQYRKRLADKGILDISQRGILRLKLPRFAEFVQDREYR